MTIEELQTIKVGDVLWALVFGRAHQVEVTVVDPGTCPILRGKVIDDTSEMTPSSREYFNNLLLGGTVEIFKISDTKKVRDRLTSNVAFANNYLLEFSHRVT